MATFNREELIIILDNTIDKYIERCIEQDKKSNESIKEGNDKFHSETAPALIKELTELIKKLKSGKDLEMPKYMEHYFGYHSRYKWCYTYKSIDEKNYDNDDHVRYMRAMKDFISNLGDERVSTNMLKEAGFRDMYRVFGRRY